MSSRQLHRKAAALVPSDGGLLAALRSELAHELSSPPPQAQAQPLPSQVGAFRVEWDDARAQDLLLRRRDEREEIAVSGLVGPIRFDGDYPDPIADVLMKVCVKRVGFDPVMHFDCKVFEDGFRVKNAYYHRSFGDFGANKYKGPQFSMLDPRLQKTLKEYLEARGISMELTTFLFRHLHNKEHSQYINWLHTLEGFIAEDTS